MSEADLSRRTWTKKPESKRNLLRLFQHVLYPVAILRPSYGTGHIKDEAARLEQFRALGVPVPRVVTVSRHVLVTEDAGPSLESLLRAEPERADYYVTKAFDALLMLHTKRLVHGRPFLRDMTYLNGTVHFLDLEEAPLRVMPLLTAQARDVMLMVFHLTKLGYRNMTPAIARYLAGREARFIAHLRKQLRIMNWLTLPIHLIPRGIRGKDVRTIHDTFWHLGLALEGLGTARIAAGWLSKAQMRVAPVARARGLGREARGA